MGAASGVRGIGGFAFSIGSRAVMHQRKEGILLPRRTGVPKIVHGMPFRIVAGHGDVLDDGPSGRPNPLDDR
jgi:hypothetical protein